MSKRDFFITGNWKMNLLRSSARDLAAGVVAALADRDGSACVQVAIAPPFTAIDAVRQVVQGSSVLLAAQDVAATSVGAYTGEVSAEMLVDAGVKLVIVGHSERRHGIGESDEIVLQKVRRATEAGLQVTLCVGETAEERDAGNAEVIVERQVAAVLSQVDLKEVALQVAYEPVWAIGTGRTASPKDARCMHAHIRAIVASVVGPIAAEELIIQYGGSAKADNAAALLAEEGVDGLLVGGASLEVASFTALMPL